MLVELRAKGLDPADPTIFMDALLRWSIDAYHSIDDDEPVLFDRGIPDCIAYAEWIGADTAPSRDAAARHRYQQTVLVFRPWEAIYTTDEERTMSFEETAAWQPIFERVYRELGYDLVEVPAAPIAERARFITDVVLRDG